MSGERLSVHDDPNVLAAFRNGRDAEDISVLNCPSCGTISYYNDGSHFTCRACGKSFRVLAEDEENDSGDDVIRLDCRLSMDDVFAAECEDYP
jgi:hypothetical protein